MKTASWVTGLCKWSAAVMLFGAVVAVTPSGSMADGLDQYTGYTRPGTPDDVVREGKIIPIAADEKKIVGATIYFRVYDLAEGVPADPWGTGYKNLDNIFKPGIDWTGKRSPTLDRSARYLYVYQAVNDRGVQGGKVQSVTIRLLVDPSRITAWGHFEGAKRDNKADGATMGISFAAPLFENPKEKGRFEIVAVSSESPDIGVSNPARMFKARADHYPTPKTPVISPNMQINNVLKPIADDPTAANVGRVPDGVMLLRSANFENSEPPMLPAPMGYGAVNPGVAPILAGPLYGAPYGYGLPFGAGYGYGGYGYGLPFGLGGYFGPSYSFGIPAAFGPAYVIPPVATPASYRPFGFVTDADRRGLRDGLLRDGESERDRDRYVAIRADFTDPKFGPLGNKERSTLFGFTSNDPPTFDAVRIRGFGAGAIVAAAPGQTPQGNLTADGGVPVPIAFEEPGAATAGATFPLLGGASGSLGGGGTGGGGFPGGGIGSFGTPIGGVSGGGSGGGQSGGGGNPNQGQQQQQQTPTNQNQQQQQQQQPQTPTNISVKVTQNNLQIQKQKQSQSQHQNQHQNNKNNNVPVQVIPEPAAMVTALLGLPALFFLKRRKQQA